MNFFKQQFSLVEEAKKTGKGHKLWLEILIFIAVFFSGTAVEGAVTVVFMIVRLFLSPTFFSAVFSDDPASLVELLSDPEGLFPGGTIQPVSDAGRDRCLSALLPFFGKTESQKRRFSTKTCADSLRKGSPDRAASVQRRGFAGNAFRRIPVYRHFPRFLPDNADFFLFRLCFSGDERRSPVPGIFYDLFGQKKFRHRRRSDQFTAVCPASLAEQRPVSACGNQPVFIRILRLGIHAEKRQYLGRCGDPLHLELCAGKSFRPECQRNAGNALGVCF